MGQDVSGEDLPPQATEHHQLGAVAYAALGLCSVVAGAWVLWVGIEDFLAGDVRAGLGPLAFLPIFVAGVTGAYERVVHGDGSRAMIHLALLLPVCILLSFLSHFV